MALPSCPPEFERRKIQIGSNQLLLPFPAALKDRRVLEAAGFGLSLSTCRTEALTVAGRHPDSPLVELMDQKRSIFKESAWTGIFH